MFKTKFGPKLKNVASSETDFRKEKHATVYGSLFIIGKVRREREEGTLRNVRDYIFFFIHFFFFFF